MFRNRRSIAPRKRKITTVVLASSVACVLIGCTGDGAVLLVGDAAGPSSVPGAAGESSADAAAERPEASSAPGGASAPANVAPNAEPPAAGAGTQGGAVNAGAGGAGEGDARAPVSGAACWQLPSVNGARLFAAPGAAAALAGGKIVGSNTSPMNDFVDLALIEEPPPEGRWVELAFDNATPYRYVKYYGPPGSRGVLAELELYEGGERLSGAAFGSAGAADGSGFELALDGDTSTWFEGALPNDNYVGIDVAAGHVVSAPTFTPAAGVASAGGTVELTAEAGTSVLYTLDGSDPRSAGTLYIAPVPLPPGTTLVRAVATRPCALDSELVQAVYDVPGAVVPATARPARPPGASPVQSSLHIGNSLTDTVVGYLEPLALDGGITLAFHRYTIPGAGTWLYDQNPSGGFGEANVQQSLRTQPFDHLTMQPFPNLPCQPLPSSDGPDSDSGYVNQAWADARTQNPNVQLWIYQQWPAPTDFVNCITGGSWTRADWQPPAPGSWDDAVANELAYDEAVRAEVARLNPEAPAPYIIPAGLALLRLKQAIQAGLVPGVDDFFGTMFKAGGADIHMTSAGAYFVSLVFYACMFQASPEGLVNESDGALTEEQAAALQRVAWETVTEYALSGVNR